MNMFGYCLTLRHCRALLTRLLWTVAPIRRGLPFPICVGVVRLPIVRGGRHLFGHYIHLGYDRLPRYAGLRVTFMTHLGVTRFGLRRCPLV